jgi:hypothetical protein
VFDFALLRAGFVDLLALDCFVRVCFSMFYACSAQLWYALWFRIDQDRRADQGRPEESRARAEEEQSGGEERRAEEQSRGRAEPHRARARAELSRTKHSRASAEPEQTEQCSAEPNRGEEIWRRSEKSTVEKSRAQQGKAGKHSSSRSVAYQ